MSKCETCDWYTESTKLIKSFDGVYTEYNVNVCHYNPPHPEYGRPEVSKSDIACSKYQQQETTDD